MEWSLRALAGSLGARTKAEVPPERLFSGPDREPRVLAHSAGLGDQDPEHRVRTKFALEPREAEEARLARVGRLLHLATQLAAASLAADRDGRPRGRLHDKPL